eukprot:scaffold126344_cov14-Prasinocladus_malaysianus.AAC.1
MLIEGRLPLSAAFVLMKMQQYVMNFKCCPLACCPLASCPLAFVKPVALLIMENMATKRIRVFHKPQNIVKVANDAALRVVDF